MSTKISDEIIQKLYNQHLSGKSIVDLAKENNLSWAGMQNRFKIRNLKTFKGLHKSTKYKKSLNEDYFNQIDNHKKAYFLGLIYADGYIRQRNNNQFLLGLGLQVQDIEIIEIFKKELECSNKIRTDLNQRKIEIQSKKIVNNLLSLGVKYNKSKKDLFLPKIDKKFINSFILGFLDGDGWISVGKRINIGICCSSKYILEEISKYLYDIDIKSKVYCDKRAKRTTNKHQDLYTLYISDNNSRLKFLKFLYKDCPISLKRKYNKFIQANTVLTSKISKGLETV